ncbi:MAG TPA: hypothetical protein VL651_14360 [Bacteroidia bacterium]|jgi:hypothetical protein|nr:hypothetical protein [Bacteroidia bacterium]
MKKNLAGVFVFFSLHLFAQTGDPVLDSVSSFLKGAKGWTLTVNQQELLISYSDSVWLCSVNMFNANTDPMDEDTMKGADGIPLYVKQNCSRSIVFAKYRMDPKWSSAKWNAAQKKNDSINTLIDQLPDKIGLQPKFIYGMYRAEDAPKDVEQKKAAYFKALNDLDQQKVIMPSFETPQFSLVLIDYKGCRSYGSTEDRIWPEDIDVQMQKIIYVVMPEFCPARQN